MKSKLRILLIEDDLADAELVTAQLETSGFSFHLKPIRSEAELRQEMQQEVPDLILSDHGLPSFSGFQALDIVRRAHPELPFIFVSGSNDQGMVANMYDQGATDYVYKRDLGDLKSAVLRALGTKLEPAPTIRPKPIAAELELNLELPASSATKPVFPANTGHLLFCPRCRRVRDEAGGEVQVGSYCDKHTEIMIRREICPNCARPQRPG